MKVLIFIIYLSSTLIGFSQSNSPIFEKYIDIFEGDILYACNHPLFLTSVNDAELYIEPIAYHLNSRMVVVGFAIYIPEHVVWKKKKTTLIIQLLNETKIKVPLFLFDHEDGICYFKFTPQNKKQLEVIPVSYIILKNNKQKCTSEELTANQSIYFIELIDQEIHQIFTPVDWSYPYYYNE